jgi:hypothetical protein
MNFMKIQSSRLERECGRGGGSGPLQTAPWAARASEAPQADLESLMPLVAPAAPVQEDFVHHFMLLAGRADPAPLVRRLTAPEARLRCRQLGEVELLGCPPHPSTQLIAETRVMNPQKAIPP